MWINELASVGNETVLECLQIPGDSCLAKWVQSAICDFYLGVSNIVLCTGVLVKTKVALDLSSVFKFGDFGVVH